MRSLHCLDWIVFLACNLLCGNAFYFESVMNYLSQRGNSPVSTSPTLAINEMVQSMWDEGQHVFHLAFGESRMPLHPKLLNSLGKYIEEKSYLASTGLPELREAVATFHQRHWNLPIDANQVIIGPGSKSLLFGIMLGVECDVYLPTPSWVSYAPQADLAGRKYTYIPGRFDSGYEITVEAIEGVIERSGTGRLPILILNSPNNPSGKVLGESKLKEIAEFCRLHQITVVSDEIYALTTFDAQQHRSIAAYYPEGTIIVGGPSKHLSLGGWRLGTAILPKSLIGSMVSTVLGTVASEVWTSPASPIQFAAVDAYSDDPEVNDYIHACTKLHELKTRLLADAFKHMGIRCTSPEGAFYFLANFDRWQESLRSLGVTNSDTLASHLLEKYQIATLPGSVFGIPQSELSLRIACSYIDMETNEKAQNLMSSFLANDRSLMSENLRSSHQAIERMGQFIETL